MVLINFDRYCEKYFELTRHWASRVGDSWWEGFSDFVVGFDFYVGETSKVGKGVKESVIKEFCSLLFSISKVEAIIGDPSPENTKLHHILEKCGFIKTENIVSPDGKAVLYVLGNKSLLIN